MSPETAIAVSTKAVELEKALRRVIRGKDDVVRLALVSIFARGHLLIEGVPGVGKTTLAQALARAIDCSFQRVQFTSDMRNGGGTALYDAIYRACKDKLLKDRPERPVRKAIIVVSDGEDNQSDVSRAQAIEMAQRAEVIIYAISTDDSGLVMRGDRVLEQLAEATGGRAFFPFKMKDITRSFVAIEDELRSQYIVSYKPADFDADGRYRSIEISSLKKDLQVRARKGYFAPQQ